MERTLVVIPAFNEEDSIASVIRELQTALPSVQCLVVDDGSGDRTADVARAAGATVAALPFNLGVGGAMRTGYQYAVENGYQRVVQLDADGQHDPRHIAQLVAALDDADLVVGARFAGVGGYRVRGPRRWAMLLLAGVLSRVARSKLTDTTSGFKAAGPRAVLLFARNYPAEYLGDTIEALVIAVRAGMKIRQVPVEMRPRAGGVASQNPLTSAAYLGRAVLALVVSFIRPTRSRRAIL
jgi:glycosyltransferase involved in cell wall biosynthesis